MPHAKEACLNQQTPRAYVTRATLPWHNLTIRQSNTAVKELELDATRKILTVYLLLEGRTVWRQFHNVDVWVISVDLGRLLDLFRTYFVSTAWGRGSWKELSYRRAKRVVRACDIPCWREMSIPVGGSAGEGGDAWVRCCSVSAGGTTSRVFCEGIVSLAMMVSSMSSSTLDGERYTEASRGMTSLWMMARKCPERDGSQVEHRINELAKPGDICEWKESLIHYCM